jgi:hypothetical protein
MGGDVLLGRAAAYAKKKGSDEGTGGSFWIDRWEDKRWGRLSQWPREGRDGGRYGNYEREGVRPVTMARTRRAWVTHGASRGCREQLTCGTWPQ